MSESGFTLDPQLAADTVLLGELELSRVLLMNDARFPWLILVPRQSGRRELDDLTHGDRHRLLDEISLVGAALQREFSPHKLNIAALGNVVTQLHVHVIARTTDDAAWPRPVFGIGTAIAYTEAVRTQRLVQLRAALAL